MKKILVLVLITSLFACQNKSDKAPAESMKPKVSVYYLHQKKGCKTCKAIGPIAKATAEKNFQKEMKAGTLAYFDLDINQPVNDSIAKRLECKWAGLYILSLVNGKEVIEDITDVAFMYALDKPDTLTQIIKSSITKNL